MPLSNYLQYVLLLVLAVLSSGVLCNIARAEHRAALLIGNSSYADAELACPPHDVKSLATVLEKRGVSVTVAENLNSTGIQAKVKDFIRTVPTNGTAIIYFSGYALLGAPNEDTQKNILLPIGGNAHSPYHVSRETYSIRQLLDDLTVVKYQHTPAGSRQNIILVEGCYEHPSQEESAPRGVANLNASTFPENSLVAYASAPGLVTVPPQDGVSAFTGKLVKQLEDPRRPLLDSIQATAGHVESNLKTAGSLNDPATSGVAPPTELPLSAKAGDEWVNNVGMVFCWCPAGKATLGSAADDPLRFEDEGPVNVTISHGFWIGKYELTMREYAVIVGRQPYVAHTTFPNDVPAIAVDPKELTERFLTPLNASEQKSGVLPKGWEYAIPTESQWEYAARAGNATTWYFGNDIKNLPQHGNFADKKLYESPSGRYGYASQTLDDGQLGIAKIGRYQPNPWGLHDVYGNVWEWCEGKFSPQLLGGVDPASNQDPKIRESIARGGCYLSPPEYCRSAMRNGLEAGSKKSSHSFVGFRLVIRKAAKPQ